jgi:hypothetical protein
MRKFYIGLGAVLFTGIFAAAAQPSFDLAGIKAREGYAKTTTMEAGPDAGVAFAVRGYGSTEWAVSVFPHPDQVECDSILSITQADIGAQLWALGFRSISCTTFDELGYANIFKYKLLAPLPPFTPLKPGRNEAAA